MRFITLVPMLCGLAVVAQAGLNRRFAGQWGLMSAVLVNMVVATVATFAVYMAVRTVPGLWPEAAAGQGRLSGFTPWHLLPGLCGVVIVLGMPWAMSRLGAVQSALLLMAAQLITSLVWDAMVEGRPATFPRVLGSGVAFMGAAIAVWKG
ncbi:DMT family transporter [Comamonas sp. JC664]|uniref:DMT family transporter n=1 Tax=Comamonas sp. JC664 TaxID=2801917 RepID=UPI00174B21F1|nr:DMT family transporter [Comamonas sp. JC664]MBL0696282.1 DMT family transporter [Comamonas sp. JC664]GHG66263.1 membrane protein [Comamonas sp. KCTC 72670]